MDDELIIEVKAWIRKADNDLNAAKILLGKVEPWVITFHAQQAVEKYLKAYLTYKGRPFKKTHDILELLDLCIEEDPEFEILQELDLEKFKEYTVEYRYPGFYEPTEDETNEAI